MRKVIALGLIAIVFSATISGGLTTRDVVSAPARQSCRDWVAETNDRLLDARSLLYPADRPGAFNGSLTEAGQIMTQLADEQADADPPDQGEVLHDDLLEAMTAAESALYGAGANDAVRISAAKIGLTPAAETMLIEEADPRSQILFAKSIIYNADARLLAVNDSC